MRELTDSKGVHVLFDPVLGSPAFNYNLDCLDRYSRWIIMGNRGGSKIEGANMMLLMQRLGTIIGYHHQSKTEEFKQEMLT